MRLSPPSSSSPPALPTICSIVGSIEISGGFSRATLPNAPVAGGYITITNKGSADDTLIAASSPVAEDVQLHEMKMEGDVMKMAELPDGIAVPAGGTVTLEPGGLHLMFMGLKEPLVENETVTGDPDLRQGRDHRDRAARRERQRQGTRASGGSHVMSLKTVRIILWSLVVVVAIGATALFVFAPPTNPVIGGIGGGTYALVDQRGEPVDQTMLVGQPSMLFFGYTHCPDVCPTTMAEMAAWFETLGDEAKDLKAFFITVDPTRDTPEIIDD